MDNTESFRFRSEYFHDLKLHKEFNKGTIHGNLFYWCAYLVLTGVYLWFFIQMVLVLDEMDTYSKTIPGLVALWCIVEGLRALFTRGGGIQFKRILMLHGGKPVHTTLLFCEYVIRAAEEETGNQNEISYNMIRIVYETKNLYLLGLKYNTFLIVDKGSLTGTREEFGQFLYEKCPKLRRKKVRNCRTGRLLHRLLWAVMAVSILISLLFHPTLQLDHRIRGQIHSGMSASEIAAELETFGITGFPQEELNSLDEIPWFLFSESKLENVLYRMGEGDRNYQTGTFTPSQTGVFFTYYWRSQYLDSMYTDLLQGISSMTCGKISIEEIQETPVSESGDSLTVDFLLNGKKCSLEPEYAADWYDIQVLNTLNTMVYETTGNHLYFCDYADVGCFIFYGDEVWAKSFEHRTGLELSSDIYETQ